MRLPPALIAFSHGDIEEGDRERASQFVRLVQDCVSAGLRGVVLREPRLGDRATLELALRLRDILDDGWLCIHDRAHLAETTRADGVHLGWRSLAPAVARSVLSPEIAIGFSSHASDDPAACAACDYLAFGPVRDTPSKRGVLEPTGFAGLARATEATTRPIWALGGMRPEDVANALDAGAVGVAVLGGIMRASDPAAACEDYLASLRARS